MRSEVLSSNFDLLNLGAAGRALFGGGRRSSNGRGSGGIDRNPNYNNDHDHNSISSIPNNRRQTKRGHSPPGPSQAQNQARIISLHNKRNQPGHRSRDTMGSTATSSTSSLFSRPPRQRSTSSRTRSVAAAAAAASALTIDPNVGEGVVSGPSSAGTKRKRPSLPRTRASSGASSRAASYRMTRDSSSLTAPISQDSSTSRRSISGSEDSSGSYVSRRTSKSTSSLRQGLRALAIESRSADTSPTSGKSGGRQSGGREVSFSPETLADSTIVSRRPPSKYASKSKACSDPFEDDYEDEAEAEYSSGAEGEGNHEDYKLLNSAPATQLERLRKDRLVTLSMQAGLPFDGLTRPQLIEGLLAHRDTLRRPGSSRDTGTSSVAARIKRTTSAASKRSMSSQSADYTDESDNSQGGDEAGHEGGGEETEAEGMAGKAASRKRKPLRSNHVDNAYGTSSSSTKLSGNRKIRGVRPSRVLSPQKATFDISPSKDVPVAATPMVNRLRNAKSIQFAASSPIRARARNRGPVLGSKRSVTTLNDPSPVKNRLRKAKSAKSLALGRVVKAPMPADDKMDEDWVDSVPSVPSRRVGRQRKAKVIAQQNLRADSDDDEMISGSEGQDLSREEEVSDEEEALLPSTQTDAEANGDDEGDDDSDIDQGDVTEREDIHHNDSDVTDVPDLPEEDEEDAHIDGSPNKMRRLRNGKVRINPTVQVQESADGMGSLLRPLKMASGPKRAPLGGGKVKVVKTKPPTPPLSDDNPEANSAGPENVDELNGLDLESLNLTDKEIPPRQLEKLSRIGSGGFKDVFVGIWKVGKRRNRVAIADIREKLTEMDIKELGLLRDLKHENIVRFIGVSIPEDTAKTGIPCMIVSELCSNGDLWDYIRNVKPPSDLQIFRMLLETAKGLEYLHMHSIVHRDVKSSNVLVTRTRSCKINDFGLARVKKSQRSKMKSVVGTINWQAVELWCRQPQYNEKVDVWSAAMTFWETLQWYEEYKKYPFEGMNDFSIYEEVGKEGKRPDTDRITIQFGEEIVKLLQRMWDSDPRKRPTMDMVCRDLERLIEVKEMEMDQ